MKHFKKFFSYLVALTMVLSLAAFTGVKVHAAEATTYKLTLSNTGETDHTFEVYQIFTGDLSTNTEGKDVLSNIQWGNGVTGDVKTALGDAAKKAEELASSKNQAADAKTFAEDLQNYLQNGTEKTVEAGKTSEIDGLVAGYYLVKDKVVDGKSTQNGKEKGATTSYILQVVKNTTATSKLDVPTVVKKVKDTNDSTGVTSDWQDSADADFNDDVQYQITGTMPSNIDAYKSYKYVFTDTMSKGLTYNTNATITIDGKDVTEAFKEAVTKDGDSTVVTWTCGNLKDISDVTLDENTKVVVTYSAKLNENAVIGAAGNPNTVYLTYSNNPNKNGEGDTGKTPEDKNIVFTYKTVVNKIDQDKKSLKGAGFTLQKKYKKNDGTFEYKDVKKIDAGEATSFTFERLDDGDYKLIESTTPAGYNTITPIEFTISAEHTQDPNTLELYSLNVTGLEATVDKDAGSLTTNVVNQKGSELPSTGGMGTTLLYVAGGILVACAAAYVVMSRKHSTNK